MKAADIMTPVVVTLRGADTVEKAITLMTEQNLRTLIVERRRDKDAYGIITETDIVYKVTAYGKDPKRVRVYEIMTKPCLVVNPDLDVEYVSRLFANFGVHQAPVIKDKLLGVISVTDILTKASHQPVSPTAQLEQEIATAIAEARAVSAREGASSQASIIAWETVEELQAEAAHRRATQLPKTAFEEYCEQNPEVQEARLYEV